MKIMGICGQSGAGKSTVLSILGENGYSIIDCDKVSRKVMEKGEPCFAELTEVFGNEILLENGEIDRKKLASITFNDESKYGILVKITHKHILDAINLDISEKRANGVEYYVIDAPLLFESGLDKICDVTVAVVADESKRIKRIVERDNISPDDAKIRLSKQISEEALREKCDIVIENNDNTEDLFTTVKRKILSVQ